MEAFLLGAGLGFAAGVSPGPLLAIVLREALRHGAAAGMRAALAPLITDSWAIALAWVAGAALPEAALRGLQLAGGLYLAYLGWTGLRRPARLEVESGSGSLRAAVLANLTNPHMYLFWFLVGAPLLRRLGAEAWAFLAGFYLLIVGSKMALAWLAARLRRTPLHGPALRLGDGVLLALGLYLVATAAG